jgi:hypothetical protein
VGWPDHRLEFFFEVTLDHGELMYKMRPVRVPQMLPVVLSRDEVAPIRPRITRQHDSDRRLNFTEAFEERGRCTTLKYCLTFS